MRFNKKMFLALALVALAGCASSGTQVTEQQTTQFQKGQTTRSEVIAKLGQPQASTKMDDGTRVDVYSYVHAAANAASYIPVVGLFAGGAHSTTNTATFTYGKNDVLEKIDTTTASADVHTGLAN